MRLITFDPEFTWSGTLFIVGATTLAGAMAGLAYHRWRLSRGQWWRLLGLFFLPLGMAAGAVMVPTFVLGGIALGRKLWHPRARILLAVLAVGFQVFFLMNETFPYGRTLWAVPIYVGFLAIETWAFSIIARPIDRSAVLESPVRSESVSI